MISKSLSTSRKFRALLDEAGKRGEFAQVAYALLIAHSDDFGRLEGDAFTVKMLCYPTSPRAEGDFEAALLAMDRVGLISWYQVDGRRYVQITQFDEHQTGLHKRTRSRYPDPPGDSGNFPEIPSEGKGTEGKGGAADTAPPPDYTPAPEESIPLHGVNGASLTPEGLVEVWNEICAPAGLPRVRELTPDRARKASDRLKRRPDLGEWREAFQHLVKSPLATGKVPGRNGAKPWQADFDWIVRNDTNAAKVLEGGNFAGEEARGYTPC